MRRLLRIHGELKAYGIDTRRSIDATVLRSLIQAREFDVVREFMRDKPHLRDLAVPAPKEPFGSGVTGRDGDRLARAMF